MSVDVTPLAYKTRLGNLTAKSVLVLLADCANDDGYGWPSEEKIADKTEIRMRTVKRILQVFVAIGLIARIDRGKHKTPGLQLAIEKLGTDLAAQFAAAYRSAQSKECRRDIDADVAATSNCVAETSGNVAETFPLKPLKGGTVKEPPLNQLPLIPSLHEGKAADAIDAALANVAKALSITRRRTLREIRKVIVLEFEKGCGGDVAERMIAAWNRQAELSHLLRVKYGPEKFFSLGIWLDQRRWHFDEAKLEQLAGASIGSYQ
jgi:hypothetical protein